MWFTGAKAGGSKRKRGGDSASDTASDWAPESEDEELEQQDAEESSVSGADSVSASDLADSGTLDEEKSDEDATPAQGGEPPKKSAKKKSQVEKEEEEALDAEVAKAAQAMIRAALKERSKQEEGVSLLHEVRVATSTVGCSWFALVYVRCSGHRAFPRSRTAPALKALLLCSRFTPTGSSALRTARCL